MKMSPYKVGIYVRESRDDNEENYETIETQRDLLIEYAKRNTLGEIYRIYIDNNVSGASFERDGLGQLKEDILNRRVDLLLVKDLSRLGRNNAKTLLFLDFIEEHGVRFLTYDGKYDSLKDNDTVGIETWFNERYIKDISRKIRASLRFKIEQGEYIGNAPYGYAKSSTEKNRLEIDEETAPVVREVFSLYRQGYGYSYIAGLLNKRGYPPPSHRAGVGKKTKNGWNAVGIQRMLSNRVYIGDTVQGVSEKISFKSKKTRRMPRSDWVVTEGTHQPIVSREDFEEVKRIRMSKKTYSASHKGKLHLFSGILYCGKCGSIMFARKRKDRPIGYICSNYSKNGSAVCTSHHIRESILKEILIEEIKKMYCYKSVVEEAENMFEKMFFNLHIDLTRYDVLRQQLEIREKHQEMLYIDKLDGKISEELFERMNINLEERMCHLKNEIARLEKSSVYNADAKKMIDLSRKALLDGFLTREIVRLLVDRIDIYDPEDTCVIIERHDISAEALEPSRLYGAVVIDFKLKKI